MTKLEEKLAQAVRNSLNLPRLRVSVRRNPLSRTWGFCLHKNRKSSDWLALDAGSIAIMKQFGLLPALHLGTFRVAYDLLRRATESEGKQKSAGRSQNRVRKA